jgi:hypothetical protein
VSASVETIRGTVSSSWTHERGASTLDVTIPAGSDAQVVIRKDNEVTGFAITEGNHIIYANGQYVAGDAGVTGATAEKNGDIIFDVGSGTYSFKLKGE